MSDPPSRIRLGASLPKMNYAWRHGFNKTPLVHESKPNAALPPLFLGFSSWKDEELKPLHRRTMEKAPETRIMNNTEVMEAIGQTSKVRNEESPKRQKATVGEDIDIISDLPESVLSHILSFLPTKDTVRTCVLSTRWKYMWKSVTNLHFDDKSYYGKKRIRKAFFMKCMDRVLLRYANSAIQNFHLSCGRGYDESRVNAVISAVIRLKVQRLHINYNDESFVFSLSLFNCNSLIELSLRMFCTVKVPTSICFPNLKILDLFKVKFLNEDSFHSKQLLLSFPVLKVLNSSFCTWLNVKIVEISAPALESFTSKYSKYHWMVDGSCDCSIKICAPCITKFKYEGYLSEDFILPSSSSIVDAAVEVVTQMVRPDQNPQMQEMGFRACMLLRNLSNVKNLTLSTEIPQVLARVEGLEAHLPTFDKLIHLKLSTLMGLRSLSRTLMDLFRSSPNLEYLVFVGGFSDWDNDDDLALELVPQCFLTHLKVVIYQNFNGDEHELRLVKFLLKNLKVLEEMTISASLDLNWQSSPIIMEMNRGSKKVSKKEAKKPLISKKEEAKKQLLSFPKASSSASIVFH